MSVKIPDRLYFRFRENSETLDKTSHISVNVSCFSTFFRTLFPYINMSRSIIQNFVVNNKCKQFQDVLQNLNFLTFKKKSKNIHLSGTYLVLKHSNFSFIQPSDHHIRRYCFNQAFIVGTAPLMKFVFFFLFHVFIFISKCL